MGLLSDLKYDDKIETESDVLGGYKVFDSDVYEATIKYAYLQKSRHGSLGLHTAFDINGTEFRESLYITTRNGDNYYTTQDGTKHYLPSFNHADALALFTCHKPLSELDTESKVIKLYDYEQKKEVPTEVPMITEMLNKPVKLGIIKERKFKQVKNNDGNYVDGDEVQEINTINKVFSAKDNRTTAEVRAKQSEAEFHDKWLEKWKGEVKDTTGNKKTGGSKPPNSGKPVSSLFA